jgi:ribonuclease HII
LLRKFFNKNILEAGCDEAGRGCLAGPVFAAAVILPKSFRCPKLRDSKKLDAATRYELREKIQKQALYWAVAHADNKEIDLINILQASFLAMHRAIEKLPAVPEALIIDGHCFKPYKNISHTCIIGGDDKYQSIAAASVLAKTYRDDYMIQMHEKHPQYNWRENKGYATSFHREAIVQHGIVGLHRVSFQLFPLPEQLEMFADQ